MTSTVTKKLESLELKMEKLRLKENMLKEKEKQKRSKRFALIGKLAARAGIDQLSDEHLLGAFFEISEKATSEDSLKKWANFAKELVNKETKSGTTPLCVSFVNGPTKEEREKMKELGFKWNQVRKEFYGYVDEKAIKNALPNAKLKIETIG